MAAGWVKISGNPYDFRKEISLAGQMAADWVKISGKYDYFDTSTGRDVEEYDQRKIHSRRGRRMHEPAGTPVLWLFPHPCGGKDKQISHL